MSKPETTVDAEFLEACVGYARVLSPGQEGRMSREEIERLVRLARARDWRDAADALEAT